MSSKSGRSTDGFMQYWRELVQRPLSLRRKGGKTCLDVPQLQSERSEQPSQLRSKFSDPSDGSK